MRGIRRERRTARLITLVLRKLRGLLVLFLGAGHRPAAGAGRVAPRCFYAQRHRREPARAFLFWILFSLSGESV